MLVGIRVDVSETIGLGHLGRCLSLADALCSEGAAVRFVVRRLGVDVTSRIASHGFEARELPSPAQGFVPPDRPPHAARARVPWALDAAETAAAVSRDAPNCVVVDHYAFDGDWHRAVRSALGCRIVAIDEIADRKLDCDIVIDPTIAVDHRAKFGDRVADRTLILGGPAYALLAQAYAAARKYVHSDHVRSVGIFMGGADEADLSSVALLACREVAGFSGNVEIVTTGANPHLGRLRELASRYPVTRVLQDLPDLTDFFSRHDLQVGAGGGANWERCCVGVPALVVVVAGNQRPVVEPLAELGAVATVGSGDIPAAADIGGAIARLIADPGQRLRLGRRGRELVDGRGAGRVAGRILG
jgi:UDP-2,4-diacetamido-2,4,6-trideoxy-beta-L-altropyranose hydrolase